PSAYPGGAFAPRMSAATVRGIASFRASGPTRAGRSTSTGRSRRGRYDRPCGRRASRRRTGPRRLGTPHPPVFRLALVHLQGLKFYATAGAPTVLVRLRVRASVPPKAAAEAPEGRRAPVSLDVAVRPAPAIRDPHKRGS